MKGACATPEAHTRCHVWVLLSDNALLARCNGMGCSTAGRLSGCIILLGDLGEATAADMSWQQTLDCARRDHQCWAVLLKYKVVYIS
jgi:hypothetical protein